MAKTLKTITEEEFKVLPVEQKRVLIAKDVLSQLKAKKIVAKRGEVLVPSILRETNRSITSMRSVQKDIQASKYCTVCAKGAVVCSLINKFNHASGRSISTMYRGDYRAHEVLNTKKIFGPDLWAELECQFEGDIYYRTPAVHKLLKTNVSYWNGWTQEPASPNPEKKSLASLMNNLIKNKGKLKIKGKLIG